MNDLSNGKSSENDVYSVYGEIQIKGFEKGCFRESGATPWFKKDVKNDRYQRVIAEQA